MDRAIAGDLLLVLSLLLAPACAEPHPLDRVPILGATSALEARIRRAIEAFERQSGWDQLVLSEIEVRPRSSLGAYLERRKKIELDPSIPEEDLTNVVWHELCHALDLQTPDLLSADQWATIEAFSEGMERIGVEGAPPPPDRLVPEAFAVLCAMGPWAAHASASACDPDPVEITRTAQLLASEVWRSPEAPSQRAPSGPVGTYGTQTRVLSAGALGLAEPAGGLSLSWRGSDQLYHFAVVDVRTGQPIDAPPSPTTYPLVEAYPTPPPGVVGLSAGVGWPTGSLAARARIDWEHLGTVVRDVLVQDHTWDLQADGCEDPLGASSHFASEQAIFRLWSDDRQLLWQAFSAAP